MYVGAYCPQLMEVYVGSIDKETGMVQKGRWVRAKRYYRVGEAFVR